MPHLHYTLDAYGVAEEHQNNPMAVHELLNCITNDLELQPVMPPYLIPYYYCDDPEDGGISAFTICSGGHVTIHTFPYRSCYFVDVMSDGFFSSQAADALFKKYLYADDMRSTLVDRRAIYTDRVSEISENLDFGPHYMIEVKDFEMTFEWIYKWLDGIAEKVGMLPISRPYVIFDNRNSPTYISGVLIVAQSHIAVHYDIASKTALIDIFSCAFLNDGKLKAMLTSHFGNKFKCRLFSRGSKHNDRYMRRDERLALSRAWRVNCSKNDKDLY